MARKRRPKRRSAAPRQTSTQPVAPVSEDDAHAIQSSRHSSEDASSERPTSPSAQTSATSVMDTDETTDPDEDDEDMHDVASIYPISYYPRPSSAHRSEMPFLGGSVMEADDMAASTRSLWAQDLDYRVIHGRRYCREYYMPNDETEQMRMLLNHQVFMHVLEGELTTVPLDHPTHVLDVGTGTGDWAIKFAETHPFCEVVGTDISAIAETHSVPMNVFFEIEDAEDWDRQPDTYDLIHLRSMEGAFRDWSYVYDSIIYSLKPGGWIEVLDIDVSENPTCFNDRPAKTACELVVGEVHRASEMTGRRLGTAHMDPALLTQAGFTDVRITDRLVPITIAERTAGKIWLISSLDSFEASCLRLLTEQLGWDPDECKKVCDAAAREVANMAKDPEARKELNVKLRVLVGRKPPDAPLAQHGMLRDFGADTPEQTAREVSSDPTEHGDARDTPTAYYSTSPETRDPSPVRLANSDVKIQVPSL